MPAVLAPVLIIARIASNMDAEYQTFWALLRGAIDMMLVNPDNEDTPTHKISFEETYSAVYKCVCEHKAEQLYTDLIGHISSIVRSWKDRLDCLQNDPIALVKSVDEFTKKFVQSIPVIVPIFAYMNRFYVVQKLGQDLQEILIKAYDDLITAPLAANVIKTMSESRGQPFSIPPAVMSSLVHNLHKINPGYSQVAPDLFAAYMTGIAPPMVEADLEAQREADMRLQAELRAAGTFQDPSSQGPSQGNSRKRTADFIDCDDD